MSNKKREQAGWRSVDGQEEASRSEEHGAVEAWRKSWEPASAWKGGLVAGSS